MTKKEEFKSFASRKPELISYVENGQMTWQKFYELYDIYGEDNNIWDNYSSNRGNTTNNISKINDLFKNIDMNSIKEHINTAQKALDFVQELTSKSGETPSKTLVTPRPLNKFFED